MKKLTVLASMILFVNATPAVAVDLSSIVKDATSKQKTIQPTSNALTSFAAQQLGMSEETVSAGLGALLTVAKDHISKDNFGLISKALPNMNSLLDAAPESSTSALTSMLGKSNDTGKKAASLGYLDAAFESIGIPKEQAPLLINSLVGYMNQSGFSKEAELLKQGLSFL